jgi:phosphonate metabolism-associated iron-containing alcohol dehydrogenase
MSVLWTYHNPVRIHFGRGCRQILVHELTDQRCLIVASPRGRRQMSNDSIIAPLASGPQSEWLDTVRPTPDINDLQADIDQLAGQTFDAVIGFGGGSVLDSAKALALTLASDMTGATLRDLLMDPALHHHVKPLPLYAVSTTSGTGSEVTPFATIWDHDQRKKLSLAGPAVFPHAAVVDPELTENLPRETTLFTGLDSINHAAESIWNINATSITIAYATRALRLAFKALPKLAVGAGGSAERDQMAECSLLAGLAISQTKTALCHSISYPITAHFGVPHGLACAFTMPAVLRSNAIATDGRFRQLKKELACSDLQQAFDDLNGQLGVSQLLKKYVASLDELQPLVDEMYTPDRANNNLAPVDATLIREVIEFSWQN